MDINGNNVNKQNIEYKKWFWKTLIILVAAVCFVAVLTIIVDPYFHYHKPITKYRLYEERYINDGIARNFDYDAIITGNSLTQNFKTSQFDELFGTNSVKLPYSGAGYKEIWESLGRALEYNDNVSIVLVGMDLEDLARESYWHRYNDVPDYLYDENYCNDVNYLLNKETLYRGTIYNLICSIDGIDNMSFDDYSAWERVCGPQYACASLSYVDEDVSQRREFDQPEKNKIAGNLKENVIPILDSNPNIEFMLIIPPSSVAKWAEYYEKGEVEYRISGLEYALDMLLDYTNVKIYAFDNEYEITSDLTLYSDTIHYNSDINEWMLNNIDLGNNNITQDNYKEYIRILRDYYKGYEYTQLNEYID